MYTRISTSERSAGCGLPRTLLVGALLLSGAGEDAVARGSRRAAATASEASIAARIGEIQGRGAVSPLLGLRVSTQGVVSKVTDRGFFMQDETGDADAETSDGIYVHTGAPPTVAAGQRVQVSATVREYKVGSSATAVANPLTELADAPQVRVTGEAKPPVPKSITLSSTAPEALERYEGMLLHVVGPLSVSGNNDLARYGLLSLALGGRLEKPTNRYAAGSRQAVAMAADNARRMLLLDDGAQRRYRTPPPYLAATPTVRSGDTLDSVTGVLDYGLATDDSGGPSYYRLQPVVAPLIRSTNRRPSGPPAVGGNVRIAAFNLHNFFVTIRQAGAACFPSGTAADCRGAKSSEQFFRQKARIVAALATLDADVVGLLEVENKGDAAVQDLLAALNAARGTTRYAAVSLPEGGTGTDAIRVAMIYKPASVKPLGPARSDGSNIYKRPPLAQTFAAANGQRFTVVVNHFKAKSGCPKDHRDVNADQGDGQGCWNARRVEQARALQSFVSTHPAVIAIGDFNAYASEDPIREMTAHGYVDQVAMSARKSGVPAYSYVFDGESGYLDHVLTRGLAGQVSGAGHWHINADEPTALDYDREYKQALCAACSAEHTTDSAYRSSDHDPVLLGLNLRTLNAHEAIARRSSTGMDAGNAEEHAATER